MDNNFLIEILNNLEKKLSIDTSDEEYMMYLEEKIEKAYLIEKEHNFSSEKFIDLIKNEIPTFYNNYQKMKANFDKTSNDNSQNFGISINFELIDLLKLSQNCSTNEEFISARNKYFKDLANNQRFRGRDYVFPGLNDIGLQEINNIKQNIVDNVDCFTPEWSGKMTMNIDSQKQLFIDGKINEEIFDFKYLDKMANFARENNMKMRMHNIIWHSQFPELLKNATREQALSFLDTYMGKLNEKYGDVIYTVDVLNEIASDTPDKVFRDSPWKDLIGEDYYIDVLKLARKNFGSIPLAYNEYGEEKLEKRKNIIEIVNRIKEEEQKNNIQLLDIVGIQSHYSNKTSDESIKDAYRELSSLGKELQITEADVSNDGNSDKFNLQTNRIFRTVLDMATTYNVKLVSMWGVSSMISWKSNRVNNFLDSNGEQTIYSKKLTKTYSKKNKEKQNVNMANLKNPSNCL